jgi:hypothetical protein
MDLDGRGADEKRLADLGICEPLADELKYFVLAGRELG